MKISDLLRTLQLEIEKRGDAELVVKHGDIYVGVRYVNTFKTPYTAPQGSVYLEITPEDV